MASLGVRDPDLRKALKGSLESLHSGEDFAIADEIKIEGGHRRLDLVIANGSLSGFEIKSDFDNLSRLSGQIEVFARAMNSLYIVCGHKYIQKVVTTTPYSVGVMLYEFDGNKISFNIVRKSAYVSLPISAYISLLVSSELVLLAKKLGVFHHKMRRWSLEQALLSADADAVRLLALEVLKSRFRLGA